MFQPVDSDSETPPSQLIEQVQRYLSITLRNEVEVGAETEFFFQIGQLKAFMVALSGVYVMG
jgi:hypothetical protein